MKTKKTQAKQQIAATLIVFFMLLMIFGSRNDIFAVGTNTTLTQNLLQGTFSMEVSTANLVFNDLTIGVGANSLGNLTLVNARDYRGTGAGWSITGIMNNLTASNGVVGVNNISNAAINWLPGQYFALDGGSNTGVTLGTGGVFSAAGGQNLIGSSTNNGMGNYKITNTMINILYSGTPTQKAAMYQNTLTLTIN